MAVTVKLVGPLRKLADNQGVHQLDGLTSVGAAIRALVERHQALAPCVLTADGSLHRFVKVYVNTQDVRYRELLDTPISDGDEITIVAAVSGG